MKSLGCMLMRVRITFAGLPLILALELVHKHGNLKVFLLHSLGKLSYGMSHFSNLFVNGGSLRHHGCHSYCTRRIL